MKGKYLAGLALAAVMALAPLGGCAPDEGDPPFNKQIITPNNPSYTNRAKTSCVRGRTLIW